MLKFAAIAALSTALLATAAPAYAGGKKIGNNLGKCQSGNGPAVLVKVNGLKPLPERLESKAIAEPKQNG